MNIFSLSAQYQDLMQQVMDSEEISDDLMSSLESVNDSLENKILNYTSILKSLRSQEKSIEEAMQEMSKRVIELSKKSEVMEGKIKKAMEQCNKEKIENAYHQIRLMLNNPRVEYSDRNCVPKEFWGHKVKETVEPDTSMISKALKEGIEVPGAYLVRDTRLSIR